MAISITPVVSQSAISLQGVGKTYAIWEDPAARLLAPLKRLVGLRDGTGVRQFTAVRDVTLDVERGECLGIIGRNGAGKSTLLQMIAGTVRPTTGSVQVRGRVAALLELGSGFNPDFTGRENIHLNAAILGLSAAEIAAKYDAIVEYSGVGEFIDQPVRTYSSGMTLRLAFAVCVHVDADILIIDEALAVGDARFQFKCHATLEQMLREGRTIIFVSHDTNAVKRMCRSALLLERGEVLLKGGPNDVTNIYTKLITSPHGLEAIRGDLAALKARQEAAPQENGAGSRTKGSPDSGAREQGDERREAKGGRQIVDAGTKPSETGDGRPEAGNSLPSTVNRSPSTVLQPPTSGLQPPDAGTPSPSSLLPSPASGIPAAERLLSEERAHQQISDKEYAYGGERGRIASVVLADDNGNPRLSFVTGDRIIVQILCEAKEAIAAPIYALTLKDVRGQEIYGTNTYFQNQAPPDVPAGGKVNISFTMSLNILPGVYFISLGWVQLVNGDVHVVHRRYDVLRFDVLPRDKSFGIAWCPTRIDVAPGA